MAAIGHASNTQTTQTNTTSTGYITQLALSTAVLDAGDDYLILIQASISGSSSSQPIKCRLSRGATDGAGTLFAGSEHILEPAQGQANQTSGYSFMTVWESIPDEAINLEIAAGEAGVTAYIENITMIAVKLDDSTAALTKGTDWDYTEDTTTRPHIGFGSDKNRPLFA